MAASGAITDLREQVPYLLVPKAVDSGGRVIERAAHYIAVSSISATGPKWWRTARACARRNTCSSGN